MKLDTKEIGCRLIDCGSVKDKTRGLPIGFFLEGAPSPFNFTFFWI